VYLYDIYIRVDGALMCTELHYRWWRWQPDNVDYIDDELVDWNRWQ
jgi:hypothetical protein